MSAYLLSISDLIKSIINNKVFRNFSYLTLGNVISQAISLIVIMKITRILEPSEYGIYTFILVQGALLRMVADLGLQRIIIRSIARNPERTIELMVNGGILRMLALIVCTFLYLFYNYLVGSLNAEQLFFVSLYSVIFTLIDLSDVVFLGRQRMFTPAIVNVGYSVLWFICIFLLPGRYLTVNILLAIYFALNLLKNGVAFFLLKYQGLLIGQVKNFWPSSKVLLVEGFPYFVLVLFALPFSILSNNFLVINSTIEEVGYFNLSERLLGPVSMIMDFALIAIFPNLSELWVNNRKRFIQYISQGFQYYVIMAIIFCFLFTLFARDVVELLFTANYSPAIIVCQLKVWHLLLSGIDSLVGTILGASNKEKVVMKLGIVRSIFATPILYFSSKYGALGLAIGFVCTFAVYQIYLWYVFRRTVNIKIVNANFLWVFSIVLFILSYFLLPQDTTLINKILVSVGLLGGTAIYLLKSYRDSSI